jgi:hypothetical protein
VLLVTNSDWSLHGLEQYRVEQCSAAFLFETSSAMLHQRDQYDLVVVDLCADATRALNVECWLRFLESALRISKRLLVLCGSQNCSSSCNPETIAGLVLSAQTEYPHAGVQVVTIDGNASTCALSSVVSF